MRLHPDRLSYRLVLRFPSLEIAIALLRVNDLICSVLRKRNADQSSSIAICRTGSNPASPSTFQPVSRLNSQAYRREDFLGYATQTIESPATLLAIVLEMSSNSSCVIAKPIANDAVDFVEAERWMEIPASCASSASKEVGELRTRIELFVPRFSFLNKGVNGASLSASVLPELGKLQFG